ncbi:MAG: histidinol dehydrogenase [Treponema sp.]|jgi:histidinol dehydrogenase|nr:histidinol dehydrogenase [Treponema sp.]
MKIINSDEFDAYWKNAAKQSYDDKTETAVREIIAAVRDSGDAAVRDFASRFDKSSPQRLEVSFSAARGTLDHLRKNDPDLTFAMELAARHICSFSRKQREQFSGFEYQMEEGLFTGQRVIPVERAAVYVPGGRFPLFSSVFMALIPALCAGVEEVILSSPPLEDGIPDPKILAAAAIAHNVVFESNLNAVSKPRLFAIGGAQAIAALAFGTESVPKVDVIVGPGSRFVAMAKKQLFGQSGIDFIAGPSDVLIITERRGNSVEDPLVKHSLPEIAAADMLAQAEHDPDARARALVPDREFADLTVAAVEKQITSLPTAATARASLDNGGLIIVYKNKEEAIRIANIIAPEHLEVQTVDAQDWIPYLKNYGSIFIGVLAAEVMGDYSAGINHILPTSGSARFTGGLSVRHFLKTFTTLRCTPGSGFTNTKKAAELLAGAEGLAAHAESARVR